MRHGHREAARSLLDAALGELSAMRIRGDGERAERLLAALG